MSVGQQLKAGSSISDVMRATAQQFHLAGVATPEADTRALLGHALRLTRAQLLSQSNYVLKKNELDVIFAIIARRLKREPVSRIVGHREFWTLQLQITPDVFDPRPDTETLIEAVLDFVRNCGWHQEKLKILDIGTGSGAIVMALLRELPRAVGFATDISQAAIMVARTNADSYGLSNRCNFIVSNMATSLIGPFDIIVSNPPYLRHDEIRLLDPEVRDYDPAIALDGSEDGLEAYHAIAQQAVALLADRGRVFVELGLDQELPVSTLLTRAGFVVASARPDLAGIPRVLSAGLIR